jgi:hypothetical protein
MHRFWLDFLLLLLLLQLKLYPLELCPLFVYLLLRLQHHPKMMHHYYSLLRYIRLFRYLQTRQYPVLLHKYSIPVPVLLAWWLELFPLHRLGLENY